jgi:hypothetical protein
LIDETDLRRDTEKAAHAKALMDDETLKEAFERLEKTYTEELFTTGARDAQAREALYLAVNVLRKVRGHLNTLVNGGKIAQKQLDELENRSKLEQMRRKFSVV